MTTQFRTYYMDTALFDLKKVIRQAKKELKDVDFDTFVGTGMSSAVVIPALASAMGKNFLLFRKDTDDSHHGSGRPIGSVGERCIFLDDFSESGATRDRIKNCVADLCDMYGDKIDTTLIGEYFYVKSYQNKVGFIEYNA